jgi:hypothetical protein
MTTNLPRLLIYCSLYGLAIYLSRLYENDRIAFDQFFKDIQVNSNKFSKFKNFRTRARKILNFLKSLLVNKHSFRAFALICFVATADSNFVTPNLLYRKQINEAIKSRIYTKEMLEYLSKNVGLLHIATNKEFITRVTDFSALDSTDVKDMINEVNYNTRLRLSDGENGTISNQIVLMITMLRLLGQISYNEYLKILLNFFAGRGLPYSIKKLLKILIESKNLKFLSKFLDFDSYF